MAKKKVDDKVLKCVNCGCQITQFTGCHEMVKPNPATESIETKQVCGMCAAELELVGWKVQASAKN